MLHAELCLHLTQLTLKQLHLCLQGPVVVTQRSHLGTAADMNGAAAGASLLSKQVGRTEPGLL